MSPAIPARLPAVMAPGTLPRLKAADCTATPWASAERKADAGNRVLAFIEGGMHPEAFTPDLYKTFSLHLFGHIVDRSGFAAVWFTTPQDKAAFIEWALNADCGGGDPTHTWCDVEQHIHTALEAHPHLLNPATWPGLRLPAVPLSWTCGVTHPGPQGGDTVIDLTDSDRRRYALRLDDDLCEALGGMLLDPPDPAEVAAETGDDGEHDGPAFLPTGPTGPTGSTGSTGSTGPGAVVEPALRGDDPDAPDIVIVWKEPGAYDTLRQVVNAEVTARYAEAEYVIASLVWSPDAPGHEQYAVTGHGAIDTVYLPEDTTVLAQWAHGYLSAATALGGWPRFADLIRRREEAEAEDWAQESARNPYM